MSVVTGLVGIIVIRLKACACSYMIHTEFVCFSVSVCLCVNKVKNRTSVETYFLHAVTTRILLALTPWSCFTLHSSQFTHLCFPFSLLSVCLGQSLWGSRLDDTGEQVDGTDRMLELYDGVLLWPAVTADCWWQGSAISNKAATKFYHFLPCSTTPGLQPVSLWSLLELLLAVSSLR